jgi:endonuclease-3 related protein
LLSVKGVGPETADSIVLYAAEKPTFVVDNYTARVWKRHGWIEYEADYYTLKDHFESGLQRDTQLFNEYHALIVRVGKEFCGKTPKCEECPLADLLPEGGVQEAFS